MCFGLTLPSNLSRLAEVTVIRSMSHFPLSEDLYNLVLSCISTSRLHENGIHWHLMAHLSN